MIRWGAYNLLILIWLIIPLTWLLFYLRRRKQQRFARLINPENMDQLAPNYKRLRARTRNIYWLLGVLLCLMALARPQWGFHWDEVHRRGLDVMVVLDTSKSMLTEDIKPTRLQQAKWGIRDLVQKLHGDRIGLVTFAGSSFLQCPLTIDYAAYLMTLDDVYAGIIPRGGTAIGSALETAINSFEEDDSEADRVIILVTDGEDHEGSPASLIGQLNKNKIRVYTIGVGTLQGELIPTSDDNGRPGYLKDTDGQVVKSALRESLLQEIALGTGGIYVRSASGDFGLEKIYDHGIDQLQRDEQDSKMVKIYEDQFIWFLLAAFVLFVIEASLSRKTSKIIRKSTTLPLIILALVTCHTHSAEASSARTQMDAGLEHYAKGKALMTSLQGKTQEEIMNSPELQASVEQINGNFTNAVAFFAEAAEQAGTDEKLDPAEAHFNLGDAHWQLQQFEPASVAYQNVLESQNIHLQAKAYYNLGNVMPLLLSSETNLTFDAIIENIDRSLSYYEKSMLLDPTNPKPKVNYELMQIRRQNMFAARNYILATLARAKQLVKEGRHEESMGLLQQFMQKPDTQQAFSVDTSSQKDATDLGSKVSEVVNVVKEAEQSEKELKMNTAAEAQQ